MKKYVENMKEFEGIGGKYEGIPLLCRLWDLEKFRDLSLYVGFVTYLGKFRASLHIRCGLEETQS